MAISEVRTQIYLERQQHEALKRAARRRSVSMAQVVREAVATYLVDEEAGPETGPENESYLSDPAWKILEAAEEIGGSGQREGAARLEDELYGPSDP